MIDSLLISIHPVHINKILSGEKIFEYRKYLPKKTFPYIALYVTAPVQKVIAVIEVKDILVGSPTNVWNRTRLGSGITREKYREYFYKQKEAKAIHLGKIYRLRKEVALKNINPQLIAPQSYRILNDRDFQLICNMLIGYPTHLIDSRHNTGEYDATKRGQS